MHWVVGDIHGMYLPLATLLDEVAFRDPDAEFIFCGDYVNRGPDSRRVVEALLGLKNARFCRGNHDDALDLLLNGKCFAPSPAVSGPVTTFEHFLRFGLDQTLHSYGVGDRQIAGAKRAGTPEAVADLMKAIPDTHRDFFHNLPVVHTGDGFFVTHAKWDIDDDPGVPSFAVQFSASSKVRHDAIWGRYTVDEVLANKRWRRRGFVGHTPVTTYVRGDPIVPLRGPKLVLLDTAAATSLDGRLTAWCVEDDRFVQADRDGEFCPQAIP